VIRLLFILALLVIPSAKAADTARATEPIDPFAYQQVQGKGMDVSWRETASGKSLYHSDVKKGLRRLEYPMSVSE